VQKTADTAFLPVGADASRIRQGGVVIAANKFQFTVAALFMFGTAVAVANGKPPAGPFPVTTTVYDSDATTGAALQLQSDDITIGGPGYAMYQTDSSGVKSDIEATGQSDWVLDLRNNTYGRAVYLTLATPAGDPISGFPVGPAAYAARVLSRCFNPAGGTSTVSWFSVVGANPNCSLRVNFTYGSTSYVLVMSPGASYAGTGLAEVYCNAVSGSSCVDWTLLPNPNVANAGVAKLYSIDKRGNENYVATCKLTFRVRVTYP
jgi:hypothetical protein